MTKTTRNVRIVGNLANIIFLIGMIFMAIVCGLIVLQGDYSIVDELKLPKISQLS